MNILWKKTYCELCKNPSCSDMGTRNIHFMDHNHCCNFTDGKTPDDFVKIPGGTFIMGDDEYARTAPKHEVTVKSFYMSKYLVTNEEFKKFCEFKNFYPANCSILHRGWDAPKQPICFLNFEDVKNYAKYKKCRLPTEAEWEYVCRLGNTLNALYDSAWYVDNIRSPKPNKVGTKLPNELGIYDMFGTILEYTEDDFHIGYSGAPSDGSAWLTGLNEVVGRGGIFKSFKTELTYYGRYSIPKNNDTYIAGIRLVKDL